MGSTLSCAQSVSPWLPAQAAAAPPRCIATTCRTVPTEGCLTPIESAVRCSLDSRLHCKNIAMPRHATVAAACAAAVDTPLDRLARLAHVACLGLQAPRAISICRWALLRRARLSKSRRSSSPVGTVGQCTACRTHGGQCQTLIRPLAHSGHLRMTHMRCKSSHAHGTVVCWVFTAGSMHVVCLTIGALIALFRRA